MVWLDPPGLRDAVFDGGSSFSTSDAAASAGEIRLPCIEYRPPTSTGCRNAVAFSPSEGVRTTFVVVTKGQR